MMETHFTNQSFNYQRNWSVRQRPIYRLLDNIDYLDSFFNDGIIQLSCFNIFKKYDNEIQGDKNEGNAMMFIKAPEGKQVGVFYTAGINAFVLSTTKQPTKQNIRDFKAVGAIKINNPISFGAEISNKIPFFVGGVEGDCSYVDSRILNKDMDKADSESYKIENFQNIQNQVDLLKKYSENDEMFLKELKYSLQDEYRLVWYVNKEVNEHLLVKCPEVLPICEKIIF